MDKVFNGRLIFVLLVTIFCLYSVYPTARYFTFISSLPDEPSAEQSIQRQQMLENKSMVKLGLDLQGGIDLLIQVETDDLVDSHLEKLSDDIRGEFRAENIASNVSVDKASNTILVQVENYEDTNIAEDILTDIFINEGLLEADDLAKLDKGVVRLSIPDQFLSSMKTQAVDAALKTIRDRVDEFGLTQPEVIKQPPSRIRVRIPGETNPQRIIDNLLTIAVLEFRMVHPNNSTEVANFIEPGSVVPETGTGIIRKEFLIEKPSSMKVGAAEYELAENIPGIPATYELMLGKHTTTDANGQLKTIDNLVYLVRDRAFITGNELLRASPYTDMQSLDARERHKVTMSFNGEGTDSLANTSIDNKDRQFAIILDKKVISAPVFRDKILYGNAQISGNFSLQEATDLALTLRGGSLPAPLSVISQKSVGATLGADSVVNSGVAILIGGAFLIIMMVGIYQTAGVIAIIAMILNVLMIMTLLAMMNATLTLSGIGGILLTMGMAVDANVLIYERLREELAQKKPLRAALSAAFSRAFTVILDSNITSLLPALVLILFEIVEGSVKGFWLALAVGLIVNMYTGLTVTRALVDSYVAKKGSISVGKFAPFRNSTFDFMNYRKLGFPISGILLAVSLSYLFLHGVNPGIDFTGGLSGSIKANPAEVTRAELKGALEQEFSNVQVVRVLNEDYYSITIPPLEGKEADQVQADLKQILQTSFGDKTSLESIETVDPLIGGEFMYTAFFSILVTCIIILGYLGMRFNFAFGFGAVAALIHDVLIALGLFVLLGHSLTLDIVSALLIILGYSVNDTIVVFDRIRENMKEHYGKGIGEIINESINQTLTRTLFTSGTTLATILSMYLFGGISLKDFSLILLIGIGVGTYSSIFVASALVYEVMTRQEAKKGIAETRGQRKKVRISA